MAQEKHTLLPCPSRFNEFHKIQLARGAVRKGMFTEPSRSFKCVLGIIEHD